MRFAIVTFGTLGDIRPYLALSKGLAEAGHEAFIVSDEAFRGVVEAEAIAFKPLSCDIRRILDLIGGAKLADKGNRPLSFLREAKRQILPLTEQLFIDSFSACSGDADAVLFNALGGISASHIAERLSIPAIGASLQPCTPTPEFASPVLPLFGKTNLGGPINRLSYELASKISWSIFREAVNNARSRVLGLGHLPRSHRIWDGKSPRMPIVYGFSPTVVPRPRGWGEWIHIAGYWPHDDGTALPEDIESFLTRSGETIYIGFGSMALGEPHRFFQGVSNALDKLELLAVVSRGWGWEGDFEGFANIRFCDFVSHDRLFPRVSAAVHHGGAGTTAAGIRNGIPQFAMPLAADQFFWADRINRLGVGPRPLLWKNLSDFPKALSRLLSDESFKTSAKRLQKAISAEDGVRNAVLAIEEEALLCRSLR